MWFSDFCNEVDAFDNLQATANSLKALQNNDIAIAAMSW